MTLKKLFAAFVLLIIVSGYVPHAAAPAGPSQYVKVLEVDILDVQILSSPSPSLALVIHSQVAVGTPFRIKFHAIYPDGEPVTELDPMQASFGLSNSTSFFAKLINATVVPTANEPGNYTYDTAIASDFPNGPVSISVLANSLRDVVGNIGPPGNVDSTLTLNPYDNSTLQIAPPTGPTQPSYLVPAIIAALLLIGLVLFLMARRRKKKK